MRDTNLVNALREHAEWAEGNQWETPITLGDDLTEAADRIEAQTKEIDALRNELCLKCGNYTLAHEGACNGCRWRGQEDGTTDEARHRWTGNDGLREVQSGLDG